MQLFAHRGVSDLAPENTMQAFALALEQKACGIELDVRLMSSKVVVMHDATVDRTTDGSGLVSEFTAQQWQALDAGDGAPPPYLKDVLALVDGRCNINIELKSNDLVNQIASDIDYALKHYKFSLDQFCVSAFDHRLLKALQALMPKLEIAPLISACPISLAAFAQDMGAQALHSYTETTDIQLINDAKARNLTIRTYTVKDAADLVRLQKLGVDAVFVNDINWAKKQLKRPV